MARFRDQVGFGTKTKVGGVVKTHLTMKVYTGNVIRDTRDLVTGDKVNDDVSVSDSISIVADEHAFGNTLAIRCVRWKGVLWKVTQVETQHPRLILRLGGVYNDG